MNVINEGLNQALDRWSRKSGPRKLRLYRTVATVVGLTTVAILVAIWVHQLALTITTGEQPTFGWFFWQQFIPMLVLGLPCYYLWYFSDLGLIRNYYEQH